MGTKHIKFENGLNLKEMAEKHGLSYNAVKMRRHRGESLDDIFRPLKTYEIIVEGQTFPSLQVAAAHFGGDYNVIKRRIQRGWSLERAFSTHTYKNRPRTDLTGQKFGRLVVLDVFRDVEHPPIEVAGWWLFLHLPTENLFCGERRRAVHWRKAGHDENHRLHESDHRARLGPHRR